MELSELLQEGEEWAETEFGLAEFGDSRRTARLVELARQLGSQPSASLPQACADNAQLVGAYRFFSNEAISPQMILETHSQASYWRCQKGPLVLAVQDTTYLDWSHHPATTGLGPLATENQHGLVAHNTLALTPERVPLGLLRQEVWARERPALPKSPINTAVRPVTKKARSGYTVWKPSTRLVRLAPPPSLCVWVIGKVISTTFFWQNERIR